MENLVAPLKLFAYTGRENGLMIVGSLEAMRDLAAKLQAATAQAPQPVSLPAGWPAEVAAAAVKTGPYRESQYWHLSFHVEGAVPAENVVPLQRKRPTGMVLFALLALAIVGAVSLLQRLAHVF